KQGAFFFQGQFFQQKFCILHMVFPSHKKSRIQRLQADIRRGFYSASTVIRAKNVYSAASVTTASLME
ncbi:hypothetical protein, partial [Gemmiger formicilis]|uniref:hypothetical protein n=1 Tax=Gemmiger formicilis TaxID=745368 RepID=UPI00307A0289